MAGAARALVVRQLLLQESARLGVTAEPLRDPEGRVETAEEAAMRTLVEREVATPEPDEAACRRFYDMNLQRFRLGDLYEAAHILIAAAPGDVAARKAARTTAETILATVEADRDAFADLAANHSDCTTSAPDGGRLGQISRGQTVPEFEAALERMKPGEVAIVETRYGFHIVRLDHRVEGKTLPFEMGASGSPTISPQASSIARWRSISRSSRDGRRSPASRCPAPPRRWCNKEDVPCSSVRSFAA